MSEMETIVNINLHIIMGNVYVVFITLIGPRPLQNVDMIKYRDFYAPYTADLLPKIQYDGY